MESRPQGLDFGNGANSVTVYGLPRATVDCPISLPLPQRVKMVEPVWGMSSQLFDDKPSIDDVWVKLDVKKNASTKAWNRFNKEWTKSIHDFAGIDKEEWHNLSLRAETLCQFPMYIKSLETKNEWLFIEIIFKTFFACLENDQKLQVITILSKHLDQPISAETSIDSLYESILKKGWSISDTMLRMVHIAGGNSLEKAVDLLWVLDNVRFH